MYIVAEYLLSALILPLISLMHLPLLFPCSSCAVLNFRRFRKITEVDYHIHHVCLSIRPSQWNNAAPNGRIFMKFGI
jgi:hypothetical protein